MEGEGVMIVGPLYYFILFIALLLLLLWFVAAFVV